RRAGDEVLEALPCRFEGRFGSLARRDVAPRANHLGRLVALVIDEAQIIANPAVIAVLFEEPVLDGVAAFLEQGTDLRLRPRPIVGMYAAPPEIRALQVIARLITQQIFDVLADEGRSKVARGFKTLDRRRR